MPESNQSISDMKLEMHRKFNELLDELDALEPATDTPDETTGVDEPEPEPADDQPQIGYIAPDSNAPGVLKALIYKLTRGTTPGQTVIKGADDKRLMLIVTSNSYEDREQETITSAALKADVDRHWADDHYMSNNPLLYWHDDDVVLGDIVWGDMVGPFYVELAREGDGLMSKRYFDYREAHPDEKWGASHRYAYYLHDRQGNGDYDRIFKQETTTLPLDAAANLITLSEVLPMSDNRAKKFDEIMGLDGAYDLFKSDGLDKLVNKLTEAGLEHKSVDTPPAAANPFAALVVGMAEDLSTLAGELDVIKAAQETQTKALDDKQAALDKAVEAVQAVTEKLQAQLDAKPRIASRAAETVTEDNTLTEDIADLMLVKDPVFGNVKPAQGG